MHTSLKIGLQMIFHGPHLAVSILRLLNRAHIGYSMLPEISKAVSAAFTLTFRILQRHNTNWKT